MLTARVASSVVLIPLVLAVNWQGGVLFAAVVAVAAAWGTVEYCRLLERAGHNPAWPLAATGAACLGLAPAVPGAPLGALALAVAVLGPGIYYLAEGAPLARSLDDWALTTLSALLIGWTLAQAVALRGATDPGLLLGQPVEAGLLLVLVALTCTWASDTAAYLAGRAWGRRPFFAAVSPRKTREGAAAGVLAPLPVALIWASPLGWPLAFAAVVGLAAGVAAIAGDLLESAFKRAVGAKDSGTVIPGHGGLLDRIDGLLLVLVTVALLTGRAWP